MQAEQLERYLDVAREQGFDALITISNEIPPVPGQHPTGVDKRKLKKVALHHLPWSEVLSGLVGDPSDYAGDYVAWRRGRVTA